MNSKEQSRKRSRSPSGDHMTRSSKTGEAYNHAKRLKFMRDVFSYRNKVQNQRKVWEALQKSINVLVNKLTVSNIEIIAGELFKENLLRGKGLLSSALIQAQEISPTFTHVYAAMVAVINSKFPTIGELILHRLVKKFRRGIKKNDRASCMASCKFIAHLVNQQVVH